MFFLSATPPPPLHIHLMKIEKPDRPPSEVEPNSIRRRIFIAMLDPTPRVQFTNSSWFVSNNLMTARAKGEAEKERGREGERERERERVCVFVCGCACG